MAQVMGRLKRRLRSSAGVKDRFESGPRLHQDSPEGEVQSDHEGPSVPVPPPPFLKGQALDRFLSIRNKLIDQVQQRPVQMMSVTSARRREGKTTVSICLACTFAMQNPERVLLIDANLRDPAIHTYLKVPVSPGLSDVLQDDFDLKDVITEAKDYPLYLIPAGTRPRTSPSELFLSSRFPRAVETLRTLFDTIILDTPGVNLYSDLELMAGHLDGTLLVIESDRSQLSAIHQATLAIQAAHAPIIGVVLNRHRNILPGFLQNFLGVE